MVINTKIEWCDHTVNLWWGCTKVHAGCKNCYAEHLSTTRFKNELWGVHTNRKRIKSAFATLDKLQKNAADRATKYTVFVGSMMDIFEENKPLQNPIREHKTIESLRNHLFTRITQGKYNNLVFLLLTKRPENIGKMVPKTWLQGIDNVWFGTSISDGKSLPYASILKGYAYNKLFISVEPQISEIEWSNYNLKPIQWVIQGGESGPKRRPFNISWAHQLRIACSAQNVPYFFKQIDKVQLIPENVIVRQLPKF